MSKTIKKKKFMTSTCHTSSDSSIDYTIFVKPVQCIRPESAKDFMIYRIIYGSELANCVPFYFQKGVYNESVT